MAPTTITGRSKSSTSNVRRLFVYLLGYRVLCGVILLACSYLPPFDGSHQIVWPASTTTASVLERFISTTLRWDSFHFLEIAQKGYTYEHLYAFFPGTPMVMRVSSLPFGYGTISGLLWGSWVTVASSFTLTTLYELTVAYTGSQELAMLSTACSILTTSPATLLHAPYAEPFFAFFSFKGMLYCSRGNWSRASLMFTAACTFRSNGLLLVGYIIWGMVLEPLSRLGYIQYRKMFRALLLSCLIVSPIILHQAAAYVQFCTEGKYPDWCQRRIPLVYSHVQAKYWDVGLFRYWTLSQIPNFLLAAPSLALLIWAGWTHMKVQGHRQLADIGQAVGFLPRRSIYRKPLEASAREESLLTSNKTTPHAVHALVLCFILVFASHTQIVLRLASSLPFTHWASARLWVEKPQVAKWWTVWCVLWSVTSLVTWGLFLPPA